MAGKMGRPVSMGRVDSQKCGDNDNDNWSTESFDTTSTTVEGGFETRGRKLVKDNGQMVTHGEQNRELD